MRFDRLRASRVQAGLTQCDLAARIGVSNVTLSRWESGHTVPNVSLLLAVAIALDVSLDYLYGRTDDVGSHRRWRAEQIEGRV